MSNSKKSRKFFVTYWEPKEIMWNEKCMKYACKCDDHCSEEHDGKWHGHYFVYYKNPRTWNDIKKYYGNDCHVEIPKCNSACIKYILGEGEHAESKSNIVQLGEMPCDNGKHLTYKDALEMTQDEIIELPITDALMVEKLQKMHRDKPKPFKISEWKKEVEVIFITGPSGIGKSLKVVEELTKDGEDPEIDEVKKEGDFWHGISENAEIAVYDDFRDSHMKASEFINFIDYNRHKLNVKGGSVMNNYKKIFITSVQKPQELYKNLGDEPKQQWMRRMKIINMWKEEDFFFPSICLED